MAAKHAKRRKRGYLTRDEAIRQVIKMARGINRLGATSGGGMFGDFAPPGQICICLLIDGDFVSTDPYEEALLILGGFKLPKKTKGGEQCQN